MRTIRPLVLGTALLLLAACGGGGGTDDTGPVFFAFTTFQDADVVLGQANATSNQANRGTTVAGNSLASPGAPCVVGGRLYVPDVDNNRVLGWNAIPAADGVAADFVLGQTALNLNGVNQGTSIGPTTMAAPWAVCAAGGRLFISDTGNHRVLIYDTVPTATNAAADLCVGQGDLASNVAGAGNAGMTSPTGIHAVGTRLLVCDFANHRVMIWNTIPTTNGVACDLVLGQADTAGTSANRGQPAPAANTLWFPFGVWSDGTRVVVADGGNNRVLIWNSFPTSDGQAADLVLGQAAFTTNAAATTQLGMNVPTDVTSDGTKLVVGDCENNRLLVYDAFPAASNTAPTTVLGQQNFDIGAGNDDNFDGMTDGVGFGNCTARTMNTTGGFAYVKIFGTQLFSGDRRNHRALIYNGQ